MMTTAESTFSGLQCSICEARHDAAEPQTVCLECGRALYARYDLEVARRAFEDGGLSGRPANMWRYLEVMPVRGDAIVSLGEGMTPLLRLDRLAARLGVEHLYVKDEGGNPTGSFKARGISAAVSKAKELGLRDIGMPTAGNAGAALAAYAARAGLKAHVAMPVDAPRPMMDEVRAYGAELLLVDGLISDAGRLIRRGCAEHGWFDMSTMKEPYRAEGKKTLGYEIWEQMGRQLPDVILYPTGGGTGLIGMWKAFSELECMGLVGPERPRMVAVQATGCAPIVQAFAAKAERSEPWPDAATLAPGIRVPHAFADDLILRALVESGGKAIAVSDEDLLASTREIATVEGLDAAPEGGSTLAAARAMLAAGEIEPDERIVIFNTGSGLKHPELRSTDALPMPVPVA